MRHLTLNLLVSAVAVRGLSIPEVGESLHESFLGRSSSKLRTLFDNAAEEVSTEISQGIESIKEFSKSAVDDLIQKSEVDLNSLGLDLDLKEHDYSDYTIYEIISSSKATTNFSKLVDKSESLVKLLNDTESTLTLFAPIDKAFEHVPDHHKKPSKEFLNALLEYHVGIGDYPARKILSTHTLPTALNESFLDDYPQRLRTRVGLFGVRVNVYSKVVAVDIKAKNGVIHAVDKILLPPAMVGRELSLFPSQFSTLLLAYEKTDFVDYIHNIKMLGSTVFAPSNSAWARLGPRTNAFLFNTDEGKKYLKALLKYQIVANTTLYSDEIYYLKDKQDQHKAADKLHAQGEHVHYELPTLLEKGIGVDIHRLGGWISMTVNGAADVGFEDGIAKNGVIQVVSSVPMPPPKKHETNEQKTGEDDVESLKELLADYVEEKTGQGWAGEL